MSIEQRFTSMLLCPKQDDYGNPTRSLANIAVAIGENAYTPTFGPDKGKLLHRRSTNVWQYGDGNWMMIARRATIYDPAVKHY